MRITKVMKSDEGKKFYDYTNEVIHKYKDFKSRLALMFEKLAEYEDTGLTPEQIREMMEYEAIKERIVECEHRIDIIILEAVISAIKQINEYRNIGTVAECKKAKEKQIPKKLKYYGDSEDGAILCPSCESDLWDLKECGFNNCPYCGQSIAIRYGRR